MSAWPALLAALIALIAAARIGLRWLAAELAVLHPNHREPS